MTDSERNLLENSLYTCQCYHRLYSYSQSLNRKFTFQSICLCHVFKDTLLFFACSVASFNKMCEIEQLNKMCTCFLLNDELVAINRPRPVIELTGNNRMKLGGFHDTT